jgi:hypothetical protein
MFFLNVDYPVLHDYLYRIINKNFPSVRAQNHYRQQPFSSHLEHGLVLLLAALTKLGVVEAHRPFHPLLSHIYLPQDADLVGSCVGLSNAFRLALFYPSFLQPGLDPLENR